MNHNIIFYSNLCEPSKHLLSLMDNEDLLKYFYKICTDNNNKVPKAITMTPTILIKGVTRPYVASDAFIWLEKIKQWKINQLMKRIEENNEKDTLLGYSKHEMSDLSDRFSLYASKMENECDESLPQSYFNVSNIGNEKIFTPPLENGGYRFKKGKCAMTEQELSDRTNLLMEERTRQQREIDIRAERLKHYPNV